MKSFSDSIIDPNDYSKGDLIGKGPFGKVYKAENKITKKKYAVKIFQNPYDPQHKLFIKEVESILKFNCPELLPVKGSSLKDFKGNENPMIITEYFPEESLEKKLDQHYEFSDQEKYILLLSIAYPLEYLHAKNIKHLNLKPSNILLDYDLYARITDLCEYRLQKLDDNIENQIGLSLYMDPEVIRNKNFTYKADVYSFGVIAYEILTGDRSFTDLQNSFDNFNDIPNNIRPDYTLIQNEPYRKLVMKCMSSDLNERPSFSDIIEMLLKEENRNLMGVTEKDFNKYIKWQCKKRAEENDPEAMNKMACMLLQGKKTRYDVNEVIRLFENAIDQNDPRAMFNYGNMLFFGIGVPKNKKKALELYERAARLNNSYAVANLGYWYLMGDEVEKDIEKAFSLWHHSADQDNTIGMLNLANAYRMGIGCTPNKSKAIKIYEKIIKKLDSINPEGVPEAMVGLAHMYRYGEGIEMNKQKAISLLTQAIDLDCDSAMLALGDMYRYGDGVQKDMSKAIALYNMAKENGNIYARERLDRINRKPSAAPPSNEEATSYEEVDIIVVEYYDGLPIKKPKKRIYRTLKKKEI